MADAAVNAEFAALAHEVNYCCEVLLACKQVQPTKQHNVHRPTLEREAIPDDLQSVLVDEACCNQDSALDDPAVRAFVLIQCYLGVHLLFSVLGLPLFDLGLCWGCIGGRLWLRHLI